MSDAGGLVEIVGGVLAALGLGGGGAYAVKQRRRSGDGGGVVDKAVEDALQSRDLELHDARIRDLEQSMTRIEADLGTMRLDLIRKGQIPSGRTGKTYMGNG